MKRLLLLVFAVAACSPAVIVPVAAPEATAAPTPARSPEVVVFRGNANQATAPFALAGDTYTSTWTKEAGCTFSAYLKTTTVEHFYKSLGLSYSDGPTSGETWIYEVAGPTSYYLDVTGSCNWTVTLTEG